MRYKRALVFGVVLAMLPSSAHAAKEHSTTDRLKDRRAVAAGARAYSIGFQDGRFYANGWHITGEMGGIWTPPLKLADGIWFGIDDEWVKPATRFTSARGHIRYAFPPTAGLRLARTDFVPDNRRAALYGLTLANPSQTAKTVTVKVDVHSELMGAYPWTGSVGHPTAADNLIDIPAYQDGRLVFTDRGTLPGAQPHDYAALVGSTRAPEAGETGAGFRGPQSGTACTADQEVAPSACDDGPHGKGVGGQLRYRVTIGARGVETVWIAVAGSNRGLDDARKELDMALQDPAAQLTAKQEARDALAARSVVDLPGDRRLQEAVEWGKQNLADLTQTATDLKVRFVDQGKAYPKDPEGTIKRASFFGAGFPDYPWLFATDGEYTAFPAVALGQFETAEAHLRAVRGVSDLLNDRSGKVAHEIVTDGSVYFGADKDPGNTDESVKFPSAVALVWRWTGDNAFRDNMYDFSKRTLRYVTDELDADKDGWPEGLGNVERDGMGEEKLDNAVYYVRGLYDLADMARSKRDRTTERWATGIADRARKRFDSTWWDQASIQYADSLRAGARVQQQHWIGVTPMEAELTIGGRAFPGLAPDEHATAALQERESDCFSGADPLNLGLFHTGCEGGPDGKGERKVFSLTTSIQAVGEGNYGREQETLHVRQRRPDVRARRDAGRAAGDPPVPGPERQHQPLLDLPLDVHAGLGPLRHRVARHPPAARRAPVAGHGPGRDRAEHPGRPDPDRRPRHPPRRRRLDRRPRAAQRQPLHDHGHRRRRREAHRPARRRHAPGRRGGRHRHARRRPRPAPHRARDQPRRRGHGARRRGRAQRGGGHDGVGGYRHPTAGGETGGRHAVEERGDVGRRDAVRAGDRGSGTGTERERPAAGPARGDRGHAGVLGRLPGRPLLRQRLAHHRRDGRDLGAAAQTRRRRSGSASRTSGSGRRRSSPAGAATRATTCRR